MDFALWEWYCLYNQLRYINVKIWKLSVFIEDFHQQKGMPTLKQPEISTVFH